MKKISFLFLLCYSSIIFSQVSRITDPGSFAGPSPAIFSAWTKLDDGFIKLRTNPKNFDTEGSVYAFEKWNNRGSIYIDNKKYNLGNVNFNMWTNTIESQVGKDSVYIFDLANVEFAYIDNRKFKSFYFTKENKNKIFEVLYDGIDFIVMKGYEVGIKRGDPDPLMVKKVTNKFFTTKTYYVNEGINIKKITLKKKTVLPLFKDKADLVSKFVKENNLSFKKDKDLKKIFNYYKSL